MFFDKSCGLFPYVVKCCHRYQNGDYVNAGKNDSISP